MHALPQHLRTKQRTFCCSIPLRTSTWQTIFEQDKPPLHHASHLLSIMGPYKDIHPHLCFNPNRLSLKIQKSLKLPSLTFLCSLLSPSLYSPLSLYYPLLGFMSTFTDDDEALIQRFIGLHTEDKRGPSLKVPKQATTSTDWSMCLLSRVISDRTSVEDQFQTAMMKAWNTDPQTKVRSVAKNSFLLEFHDKDDLEKALHGGPWTFKGDLVAFKEVRSHEDLNPSKIKHAHIWVQLFNIPLNAFTEEGISLMGGEVGTPLSRPIEGFVGGKRFHKIKIKIDLQKPVKDKVKVTHPILGELKIFCVFEKVNIICVFCGHLGHDLGTCVDHSRLSTLLQNPAYESSIPAHQLLSPTRGAWITNVTKISRAQIQEHKTGLKRNFN